MNKSKHKHQKKISSPIAGDIKIKNAGSGFIILVIATAIAGLAGYIVTWIVYRGLGPSSYTTFALFWSALFLLVGGLSGVQQEISRATRPKNALGGLASPIITRFATWISLGSIVTVTFFGLIFLIVDSKSQVITFLFPLALGVSAYTVLAIISGSLYGISRWKLLGLVVIVDSVLRLIFVTAATFIDPSVINIAWAVSLPFVITPVILFFALRNALYKKIEIDVSAKNLSLNSVQTVFAAFLTSIIVSGFPLLLGISSPSESQSFIGELIFIIMLTRAPLVVVVASLQSYFVILFRGEKKAFTKYFLTILGIIFSVTLLLMIAFSWWGVYLFELITSRELRIDGSFLAVLVCSSGLVASLTVTGAALLSKSKHSLFVLGWLVAALMTLCLLFTGFPIIVRIELSLTLAPAVGVLVHILSIISLRMKKNS